MTVWDYDSMGVCQYGRVTVWLYDFMTVWEYDGMGV